jgi:MerR family copper efflux transcriptional regulator
MTALTIQEVSRRSGLSEPTLRYYEEVGLIGPVDRDARSGHRRYHDEDLDVLQALACMRALGVGIEDMRVCQANRSRGGHAAASSVTCCCVTPSASGPRSRPSTRGWTT